MEGEEQSKEAQEEERQLSRRRFLKLAAAASIAGGAVALGGGLAAGNLLATRQTAFNCPPPVTTQDADGRTWVDYDKVPKEICAPVLHIAQWYDYWPGSFIESFKKYIRQKYGVLVDVKWPEYYSNEELLSWVSLGGQKFDIMFPTNYMAEILDRGGYLLNMNEDWLPNLVNLDPVHFSTKNPQVAYQRRSDPLRTLRAVPYQWGTTGIGFRTDIFDHEDVYNWGYDLFWESEVVRTKAAEVPVRGRTTPLPAGPPAQTLFRRTTLLDDQREVFGATFKKLGWDDQVNVEHFETPTAIPLNQEDPYKGRYQWSQNQKDPTIVARAEAALKDAKKYIYNFETPQQGPFLVQGTTVAAHGWMGDMMYAIQPNSEKRNAASYLVPRQGGARWIDNATIGSTSKNLWLAHEFINFVHDPEQQAGISDWNLYATPNAAAYELLTVWPNKWDPRQDERLYATPDILKRCEFQRDLGPAVTSLYGDAWSRVKSNV